MGLFGGKDDTKKRIEELKARMNSPPQGPPMQAGPGQPPVQQGWQPPQQNWQPPPQDNYIQNSIPVRPNNPQKPVVTKSYDSDYETTLGIVIDLGDGISLNLPIKDKMSLEEFLRIADKVRELAKIDHHH